MTFGTQNEATPTLTVLVVDDDRDALEELQDIVDLEGWSAIIADSVDMALEVLEWYPHISVVVTDVHFVDPSGDTSNGFQLMSRAKARFPERELSFVVLSGGPSAQKSTQQTGAIDFLSNPLDPDQLISAVRIGAEKAGTAAAPPAWAETGEDLLKKVQRITKEVHAANVHTSGGTA